MMVLVCGPGPDGCWSVSVCDDDGCLEDVRRVGDCAQAADLARALAAEYGCDWLEECPPE